jgi:indolepyruvate ferredoxin oxidoreductase beta subunit
MLRQLGKASDRIIQLDAAKTAEKAGSRLATNIVMLGALFGTGQLPIKMATIKETVESHFPAKLAPVNIKAFDLGYEACRQAVK